MLYRSNPTAYAVHVVANVCAATNGRMQDVLAITRLCCVGRVAGRALLIIVTHTKDIP